MHKIARSTPDNFKTSLLSIGQLWTILNHHKSLLLLILYNCNVIQNSGIAESHKIKNLQYMVSQKTPTLDEDLCLDSCSLYFSISSSARFRRTSVALWDVVCCFCCRFSCSNSYKIKVILFIDLKYNYFNCLSSIN